MQDDAIAFRVKNTRQARLKACRIFSVITPMFEKSGKDEPSFEDLELLSPLQRFISDFKLRKFSVILAGKIKDGVTLTKAVIIENAIGKEMARVTWLPGIDNPFFSFIIFDGSIVDVLDSILPQQASAEGK
jgi:hypothetical protein